MAREFKQTRKAETRGMYVGIFRDFPLPSGKPKILDLIPIDKLEWKTSGTRRRRRSEMDQGKILQKLWEDKERELQTGEVKENTKTLKKTIDDYIKYVGVSVCDYTIDQYNLCLGHLLSAVGDFDIKNPPENLDVNFLSYLQRRGISKSSINSYIRQVQSFFIWCDEQNITTEKIKLKKDDPTNKIPIPFSEDELDKILGLIEKNLSEAGENEYKRISAINQRRAFMMFRYTGARAGELRTLPLNRISLVQKNLVDRDGKHRILIADVPELGFRVKGKHEGLIPIGKKELLDFLEEDLANRDPKEQWYLDNGLGEPQWNSVATFGRVFDSHLKKLGIKGVKRTHGFRATVISNLLNKGTPAVAVQMLARHADLSTTLGYYQADQSELREHIEAHL